MICSDLVLSRFVEGLHLLRLFIITSIEIHEILVRSLTSALMPHCGLLQEETDSLSIDFLGKYVEIGYAIILCYIRPRQSLEGIVANGLRVIHRLLS